MKTLARLALAAGAAVGLSAVVLPAVAGADPAPASCSPTVAITRCSCRRTTQLGTRSWRTTAMPTGLCQLREPTPPEASAVSSTARPSITSLRRAR